MDMSQATLSFQLSKIVDGVFLSRSQHLRRYIAVSSSEPNPQRDKFFTNSANRKIALLLLRLEEVIDYQRPWKAIL